MPPLGKERLKDDLLHIFLNMQVYRKLPVDFLCHLEQLLKKIGR